jgi:hypothetical protein
MERYTMTSKTIGEQLGNIDHIRFEISNAIIGANNSGDTVTARLLSPVLEALDDHRGDVLIPALRRASSMEQIVAMRADEKAELSGEQIRLKHGSTIEQIERGLVRQDEYAASRAKAALEAYA